LFNQLRNDVGLKAELPKSEFGSANGNFAMGVLINLPLYPLQSKGSKWKKGPCQKKQKIFPPVKNCIV
jgi:hypothetical protein